MNFTKNLITTCLGLSVAATTYGQQDLIQQVPENASFVVVINNEAIVKHSSFEMINELLENTGAFEAIGGSEMPIQNIHDLDLSYDRNAYIYRTDTDSSYYTGILLPLKVEHQVGANLFSKFSAVPASQGYERRVSADKKTQVAWNEHSLFILTGDARRYYFDNDSVAQRYGLVSPTYGEIPSPPAAIHNEELAEIMPPEDTAEDADYVWADTVETEWEAYDFEDFASAEETADTLEHDDYSLYDSYSDESYQMEMALNEQNDSLRNEAFASWLAHDFDHHLQPAKNASTHKFLTKFDKNNTLVHFWAKNLMSLYSQSLPYYLPELGYSFTGQIEKLAYAYQDIVLDLVQDKHTLKLAGSVQLSKEMDRLIKPVYKNKMNRKFARYIPANHIGYMSLNFNSEAYLKSFPRMVEQLYGSMMYFSVGEIAGVVATALEIALDEKAIAQVMGGDHLLFINEMKKVKKEYIDYEYDEDTFDYKEITKVKDDYIPTFLWMFTSKDQRIYKKILKLGESKDHVFQTDGIYHITGGPADETIYALFKDDIIFVSNDAEQLTAIHENRFQPSRDKQIKKLIFANNLTAVTHLSEIPESINRLGIPVLSSWDHLVNNLSSYGDIRITAQGNKKGRITGELAVDFPKQETNALQYLLQELMKTIDN